MLNTEINKDLNKESAELSYTESETSDDLRGMTETIKESNSSEYSEDSESNLSTLHMRDTQYSPQNNITTSSLNTDTENSKNLTITEVSTDILKSSSSNKYYKPLQEKRLK